MFFLKRLLSTMFIYLLSIFALLMIVFVWFKASLTPSIWFVRWAFNQTTYTDHENLSAIKENVEVIKDLDYPSEYNSNQFDIIVRKDLKNQPNVPTILWIHGGAFVAGDKTEVENYMIVLANEGYAIINMNYALGYETHYPAPIIQIGEMIQYMETIKGEYPFINDQEFIIGGDSAGAFLAAQFTLIQTNPNYATLTSITPVLDKDQLLGIVLFCGPYDFTKLRNLVEQDSKLRSFSNILTDQIIPFFANNIGYAFLGDYNWVSNESWEMLTLNQYVTSDFPTAFITDANTLSFEDHGKQLGATLKSLGVDVTEVYYEAVLTHEYQFNLGTISSDNRNYAKETFDVLLSFLENIK